MPSSKDDNAADINGIEPPTTNKTEGFLPATRALHADEHLNQYLDVSPAMHVSTTFRYSNEPAKLEPLSDAHAAGSESHIYSRLSAPNTSRLEAVLSSLLHGRALTYSSGLAAFHAMLVHLNPRRIAIGGGYHGCHGVVNILTKLNGLRKVALHDDDAAWDAAGMGKGDVVHIETPINPTGEATDIADFAERAHRRGCILTIDATFGPPGLQEPFALGADIVMHSGTKYIGGHSDLLCGILAVRRDDWWKDLWTERLHLGSVMGSFEGWLGLRSIRTLELRVQRQSASAERLVAWLADTLAGKGAEGEEGESIRKAVLRVQHASLQKDDMHWLKKQMPNGFGPVFVVWLQSMEMARAFPSKLKLFQHATSLGGVESLIEWRRMSDDTVDVRVLRVSVGVEAVEDLQADMLQGFRAVLADKSIR